MGVGLQTAVHDRYWVFRLVEGATTGIVAPTTALDGVAVPKELSFFQVERAALAFRSRSGTGTLGVTFAKLHGYLEFHDDWYPVGIGSDLNRGKLNGGLAIGEVYTNDLKLIETIGDLALFDRLAVELDTVTGTDPVFDVDLFIPKHFARYGR